MGCLYKLLAKILALHLKSTIQRVISNSQDAFILGRQITDCSLMANECIDAMRKNDNPGVVCKIDIKIQRKHMIT